jgi:hypothetical protein
MSTNPLPIPLIKVGQNIIFNELLIDKDVQEIRNILEQKIRNGVDSFYTIEIDIKENIDSILKRSEESEEYIAVFKNDSKWKKILYVIIFFDFINTEIKIVPNSSIIEENTGTKLFILNDINNHNIFDDIMHKDEDPSFKNGKIEIIFEIPKQKPIELIIDSSSLTENKNYYNSEISRNDYNKE